MANKKKAFATTTAAVMAASAVAPVAAFAAESKFPDVPSDKYYADAVNYLAEREIINGTPEGTFNPTANITRDQAAKIIVLAAGLEGSAELSFKDNDAIKSWAVPYVKTAVANKVIEGNDKGYFNPEGNLTRAQAAKIIVEAFGLEGTTELSFKDNDAIKSWAVPYVKTAVANGIIEGSPDGNFNPEANIERGDFALMVKRAIDKVAEQEDVELAVESVSAIDAKTLEVTGKGLKGLKTEDVTIEGNIVASVNANEEGTKATVTFQNGFPLDTKQTVKIGEEEFTFTYTIEEIKSVTLDDQVVDDDTEGQILTFKINGAPADTEWLRQAGYQVNFVAADEDNVAASIFAGGNSTSSTGLLADEIDHGIYTVEIQVTKDGKVVVSDKAEVTVTDLESTVTAIDSVELTTTGGVVLNSTTLVVGETANITEIIGDAAGKKDVSLPVTSAEVTTSNPAVISVNEQTLTANVAGKATITVKIGNVTKTLNLTVESAARKVAKVTPSESTVKVVEGETRTIAVTTLDQYGDPFLVATGDPADPTPGPVLEDMPEDAEGNALVTDVELVTAVNGKGSFAIEGANKGNGTILFKDEDDKVIGQIAVQVTDVDNEGSTKVEHPVATTPVKYTIDAGASRDYQISIFNTNGFYNGAETLNVTALAAGQLFVESADEDVAKVALVPSSTTAVRVTGVAAGKTDITFKDEAGKVVHKITVTIEEEETVITNVDFTASTTLDYAGKTINVKDVLDVRADTISGTAVDPIVYGIKHNANTIAKVRLDESNTNELIIYIDGDGDGALTADPEDIELGAITAEVLTGATGTVLNPLIGQLADISSNGGTYTTASGDKGTILFRVLVDKDNNGSYTVDEAIATTVINIDVN